MLINGPIDIDSLPSIPWKNGGGTTRTLAVEPADAGLDNFIWRISLAEIHESGSFSAFPGIDRTILLWRGEGFVLRSPHWPQRALTKLWQPFRFAGEDEVTCELIGQPASDLNLMVRRDAARGAMSTETEKVSLSGPCDDVFVLCAAGKVHILLADRPILTLDTGQFVRLSRVDSRVDTRISIVPEQAATFIRATMTSGR